jgi:hypothetical protein
MLSVPPVLPPTTEHDTDADLLSWKQRHIKEASFDRAGAQESSFIQEIASKDVRSRLNRNAKRRGLNKHAQILQETHPRKCLCHKLVYEFERLAYNPNRVCVAIHCSVLSFCPPILRENLEDGSQEKSRGRRPHVHLSSDTLKWRTHLHLNHSWFELISWSVLDIKPQLPRYTSEFLRLDLRLFYPSALVHFCEQASAPRQVL